MMRCSANWHSHEKGSRSPNSNVAKRRDGAQAHVLQDVGRLELASQRRAEIAFDKGEELRPPELDELDEGMLSLLRILAASSRRRRPSGTPRLMQAWR